MDTKECSRCHDIYPLTNYPASSKNPNWRGKVCQRCRNEQRKERYHAVEKLDPETIQKNRDRVSNWRVGKEDHSKEIQRNWRNSTDKGYWSNKITSIKANCRVKGLSCSIRREDLEDLFDAQNGRCVLTGRELKKTRIKSELDTCSVDRLDDSLGYDVGNIRLVTLQANIARWSGNDEELLAFCKDVITHLNVG